MKNAILLLFLSVLISLFFSCTESVSIATSIKGEGVVNIFPEDKEFAVGAEVVLEAIPGEYSSFSGWTGDLESKQNPVSVTLNSKKSVTALCPVFEDSNQEVRVYSDSGRNLSVGDECNFIIDLDLLEGDSYLVFIYADPSTINAAYSASKYEPSSVVEYNQKNISRYGYIVDADSNAIDGSCTHWYIDIDSWDGTENTDYGLYRFEYPVKWE